MKANNITGPGKWRFERKYVIPDLSRQEVETIISLHPAMFSRIYHQRFVNNIYLDSVNMESYIDNIEGLLQRVKVRIRWYGDLLGEIENPVLEVKIRNGLLGTKDYYPLKSFSLETKFDNRIIFDTLSSSEIPETLRMELQSLVPVLLNRYTRNYYQSADKNYRITVDTGLTSYRVSCFQNLLLDKASSYNETIVELKYKEELDHQADCIAKEFPFRLTKSSKYVCGVEMLY